MICCSGSSSCSSNSATAITPTLRALPFWPAYEPPTDENRKVATSACEVRKPSIRVSPYAGTTYPRLRRSPFSPSITSRPSTDTTASMRRAVGLVIRMT